MTKMKGRMLAVSAFIVYQFLISGCSSKPSNEIEALSSDVLKHKQGVEIDVKPIAK